MPRKTIVPAFLLTLLASSGARAADLERINESPFLAGSTLAGASAVGLEATSADGRFLLFATDATAVIPGVLDVNGRGDLFVKDLQLGTIELISHAAGMPSLTAGGFSGDQQLSADGNVVVFASSAPDLVAPPRSGASSELYWHDRSSGVTRRVCHPHGQPNQSLSCVSSDLRVSADGRYVVFESLESAALFVPGATDTNASFDLFLWDALEDGYRLVTHVPGDELVAGSTGAGLSSPLLSADGRFLAYAAASPDLVAGDTLGNSDVFLYDRDTGVNRLVSRDGGGNPANGSSFEACAMTADGGHLLFESLASNLDPAVADGNGASDLFLFDRAAGTIGLISRVPAGNAAGNGISRCGLLSEDGRYVYFLSQASNLVTGIADDAASRDHFLHDRQSGATRLVTRFWSAPAQAAGGSLEGLPGKISADGGILLFSSASPNLADATHRNGGPWSFRYDRDLDQLELALPGGSPSAIAYPSRVSALAADGSTGIFAASAAAWLTGAPGPERDLPVLVQRGAGPGGPALVAPAAYSGAGTPTYPLGLGSAAVSGDGSAVVFEDGTQEICGSSLPRSLCLHSREAGTYVNINHRYDDPQAPLGSAMNVLGLSGPDGRYVLVQSAAGQLAPMDINGGWDLFLYDSQSRSFELVSRRHGNAQVAADGVTENFPGGRLMTADAGRIVFESKAIDLVAGFQNHNGQLLGDVYLRDRVAGTTQLVSHRVGLPASGGNVESRSPKIAGQGGYVVFLSNATDLVTGFSDTNGVTRDDVYLFEAATGNLTLVSHAAGSAVAGAGGFISSGHWISANGRFVAFGTAGANLVAAGGSDTNGSSDVFLFDRATGLNTLVSHAAGQLLVASDGDSAALDMSSDGRYLLIGSSATNLLPAPMPSADYRLYLWDAQDGSLRLVSHRQGAPSQPIRAIGGRMAADGSRVVFATDAPDVIPGLADANGKNDLFAWHRSTGRIELLTARFGDKNATGNGDCSSVDLHGFLDQGQAVLFACGASDLLRHDASFGSDLFLADLTTPLFADGFESAGTGAWSFTQP